MASNSNNNGKKSVKSKIRKGSPTAKWASSAQSETYNTVVRVAACHTGILAPPTPQKNQTGILAQHNPSKNLKTAELAENVSVPDLSVLFGSTEETISDRKRKLLNSMNNDFGLKKSAGSDFRDRFWKSKLENKKRECKCTFLNVTQRTTKPSCRSSIKFNSALQSSVNTKNPTVLKIPQLDTPRQDQIFIDASKARLETENMNYAHSGGFVAKQKGSIETTRQSTSPPIKLKNTDANIPTVQAKNKKANNVLVEEGTTEIVNISSVDAPSDAPCASTSLHNNVCDFCRQTTQPTMKTLKQRNMEMHAIRMDVEAKRLELLELKQCRERNEMARDLILFQKELELKEAKMCQVLGDRRSNVSEHNC